MLPACTADARDVLFAGRCVLLATVPELRYSPWLVELSRVVLDDVSRIAAGSVEEQQLILTVNDAAGDDGHQPPEPRRPHGVHPAPRRLHAVGPEIVLRDVRALLPSEESVNGEWTLVVEDAGPGAVDASVFAIDVAIESWFD